MIRDKIAARKKLWALCKKFIKENGIGCPETIYQCDDVVENAQEFIENICDIVGYEIIND